MKTIDKKKVVAVLKEERTKIKVGWFTFRPRPLTLCQIYEMGVYANQIKEADFNEGDKINNLNELIKHSEDARQMCEIFIICTFRKAWARRLWGRYIRKHLDILAFNQLIMYISSSFNANFFLTSIIFLTKTKVMTEPKTTPLGQQSEQ